MRKKGFNKNKNLGKSLSDWILINIIRMLVGKDRQKGERLEK